MIYLFLEQKFIAQEKHKIDSKTPVTLERKFSKEAVYSNENATKRSQQILHCG